MPIEITRLPNAESRDSGDALVGLQVIGTLDKKDYELAMPQLEHKFREHGEINMLIELVGFTGVTPAAVWEDLKFDIKHLSDIRHLAVVGEHGWEKVMTKLTDLFMPGEARFFENTEDAHKWLEEKPRKH